MLAECARRQHVGGWKKDDQMGWQVYDAGGRRRITRSARAPAMALPVL
jgi:hypothetical protein